jgi:DNA-binding IclR family transcriptional regulator
VSKSARRTLSLLSLIAEARGPVMLMEVARRAELDKSTTSRLLADLEDAGLVERDRRTRAYRIGPHGFALAGAITRNVDFRFVPRSRLEALRDLTCETVMIQMRSGTDRVVVGGIEGTHPMRRVVPLGEHHSLSRGASSRVLLSLLGADEVEELCAALELGPEDRRLIDAAIETVQRDGFLAERSDSTAGVCVLCVPLRPSGPESPAACLTISGPEERWTLERCRDAADDVLELVRGARTTVGEEA